MESAEDWVTGSFTALPSGWLHECLDEDGDRYETPCPGVLVQELRGHWKAGEYALDHPSYDTRVVFAFHDTVDGTLTPVTDASNVMHTWAPKDPRRSA
jgi:hypothetical protein